MSVSHCIGCGCHDLRACINSKTKLPCSWVRVDEFEGIGVCSECKQHVTRWDKGDRTFNAQAHDAMDAHG